MEPDIVPLHPSSPPPLDDYGDEEDEFGDFGGFSVTAPCSSLGFAYSTAPPSSHRRPSPTTKPATHQSNCHPAEQSQPASIVSSVSGRGQTEVQGQDCNVESSLHLPNGYAEIDHSSETHSAAVLGACSPKEETGFADFTVFTEQEAHPWCCGFSPIGSTEQWGGGVDGTNVGGQICDPGQEVVMDFEPGPHTTKENVCTKVEHCEKRDTALMQPSQDHHQPQEAAAAAMDLPFAEPYPAEEDEGKCGDSWRERRHSFNSLQTSEAQGDTESEEDREKSISTIPQTFSAYESASEDLASFCDDFSCEGASVDLEPNVSSLGLEDQTDWDQTDDEDENLGSYRYCDSFVNNSMASLSQAENGFHHCNQSAIQETTATSNFLQSRTHTVDKSADFKDGSFAQHSEQEHVQTAEVRVQSLGSLPPSDSFADFCSAPTQEDEEGSWVDFKDQMFQEDGKTWTQFKEQVSSLHTEEEQGGAGQYGGLRQKSSQASLSCCVQQLLRASFPEAVVPAVDGEEELFSLGALLHGRHLPESEEEEKPELSGAQGRGYSPELGRAQWDLWWQHQDVHSAIGLQFQWEGSHANRTLLRCLGVDTRNIVFIGIKKQPVAVPAFASGLGMLEPTKDSVTAVCSPQHTAAPGPTGKLDPSRGLMQEELPSSQLDWSSHGLSSSQDGVDPELYELTISKLETSANRCHLEDTLNCLMSAAVKTSTSVRNPQQDEELTMEASRVVTGLPNLSFMMAKVLMFPSILLPRECSAE
uniref:Aftiphilin clathrin-binding box domain-containing protein n=1 Tax=Monopterus albus TaxID=43700 RepID=A0A3Q3K967_MONAL